MWCTAQVGPVGMTGASSAVEIQEGHKRSGLRPGLGYLQSVQRGLVDAGPTGDLFTSEPSVGAQPA